MAKTPFAASGQPLGPSTPARIAWGLPMPHTHKPLSLQSTKVTVLTVPNLSLSYRSLHLGEPHSFSTANPRHVGPPKMGQISKEQLEATQKPVEELHSSAMDSQKDLATLAGSLSETKSKTKGAVVIDMQEEKNCLPPGLLATEDLATAIETCRKRVERIAKDCRARNRKFRDVEFDLEADTAPCLYGLTQNVVEPTGVHRVAAIFEAPHFFNPQGVASSNDIRQGALGDCWFLSALATISALPRLVEQICVARDETVGVYGFVFYRDSGWVSVIIDDMLCTNMPKYEELNPSEQNLYHDEKEKFLAISRKGGRSLTFAKSGSQGETWVPLIEKAYAKFYGNYSHLDGGFTREAIEDLTGGVATLIHTNDILDPDYFWKEELSKAREDRLFACCFEPLNTSRSTEINAETPTVQGLFGGHAYSVLRAVECKGKRFVVVRNPWGQSEWTGRWADGSKEWTPEWLQILPELGHTFGDDGQFVMEYEDFLQYFSQIDRSILFDSSWVVASNWLTVPVDPPPSPWTYGNVSYIIRVPERTKAIITLSQLNRRFFNSLPQDSFFSLGFVIVKQGETEPLEESLRTRPFTRSVNMEVELDAGVYFVYVKLEHTAMLPFPTGPSESEERKPQDEEDNSEKQMSKEADAGTIDARRVAQILSEKVIGQTLSSNYSPGHASKFVPVTLDQVIQNDIDYMLKHKARPRGIAKKRSFFKRLFGIGEPEAPETQIQSVSAETPEDRFVGMLDALETTVTLGLKVYTQSDTPVDIVGRLPH